jgi:hypothetical protein
MKSSRSFHPVIVLVFSFAAIAAGAATGVPTGVAALAFLTGHWRGTLPDGRVAEEVCTTPEGGVLLSAGREFADGKCVFFDLVVFAEKDGTVVLTPHPFGRRSEHAFPLVALDAAARRAVFENLEHDFPKRFVYELVAADRLRITLTGEMKGQAATEVYNLTRVP